MLEPAQALAKLVAGNDLSSAETEHLFGRLMDGQVAPGGLAPQGVGNRMFGMRLEAGQYRQEVVLVPVQSDDACHDGTSCRQRSCLVERKNIDGGQGFQRSGCIIATDQQRHPVQRRVNRRHHSHVDIPASSRADHLRSFAPFWVLGFLCTSLRAVPFLQLGHPAVKHCALCQCSAQLYTRITHLPIISVPDHIVVGAAVRWVHSDGAEETPH